MDKVVITDPQSPLRNGLTYGNIPTYTFFYATGQDRVRALYYKGHHCAIRVTPGLQATWFEEHQYSSLGTLLRSGSTPVLLDIEPVKVEIKIVRES